MYVGSPYGQLVDVTNLFYTVNPYCCAPVSHGVSFQWLTAWLTSKIITITGLPNWVENSW